MDSIQILFLAVVQGITELLPISSTGHVLLASKYLFNGNPDVLLLTILQFGTTVAIVVSFREFLFKDIFKPEKIGLYLKIAIASLPAIVIALLLEDYIQTYLYTPLVIAISLLVWGIGMIWVEKRENGVKTTELTKISTSQAFLVGVAQSFAIIPGTSRSGSTTVVGILVGIEKYTALRFSFLLGIPILIGSFVYEMYRYKDLISTVISYQNILAMIISGAVGYLAIILLEKFSKKNFLFIFGMYRIVLAIVILLTLF